MPTAHFSNRHIFSFLNPEEEVNFITLFEEITLKKGTTITVDSSNIFYYYIESGKAAVSFDGKSHALQLLHGDGFGRLPFALTDEKYEIIILQDTQVLRSVDEKILRFLLKNIRTIRGYLNALKAANISIVTEKSIDQILKCSISCITGDIKSGKTILSLVLAHQLSLNARVLLIDASQSAKSCADYLLLNQGKPIIHKENEIDFDIDSYILKVSDNLALLNFSHGVKPDSDGELLKAVLVHSAFNYDYIIIDSSLPALVEYIVPGCDTILHICKNEKEKRSAFVWFDKFITEGQSIYYIGNNLYNSSEQTFNYCLPQFDEIDKLFQTDTFEFRSGQLFNFVKNCESFFFEPYYYRSLPMVQLVKDNPNAHFFCSGFSSFFILIWFFYADSTKFTNQISDFFQKQRQKLMFKLVYPDERLYSAHYFNHYVKKIFGSMRLEELTAQVVIPLADKTGKLRLFSSGRISDLLTAAFSRTPYFGKHYINGHPYSASFTKNKNILCRKEYIKLSHVSVEIEEIIYPFRTGSFLHTLLTNRDNNITKGDFIIDLSLLDLYNIQALDL